MLLILKICIAIVTAIAGFVTGVYICYGMNIFEKPIVMSFGLLLSVVFSAISLAACRANISKIKNSALMFASISIVTVIVITLFLKMLMVI